MSDTTQSPSAVPNPPSTPTETLNVCSVCEYHGSELICPTCTMLMEKECANCHRALSDCICELRK